MQNNECLDFYTEVRILSTIMMFLNSESEVMVLFDTERNGIVIKQRFDAFIKKYNLRLYDKIRIGTYSNLIDNGYKQLYTTTYLFKVTEESIGQKQGFYKHKVRDYIKSL